MIHTGKIQGEASGSQLVSHAQATALQPIAEGVAEDGMSILAGSTHIPGQKMKKTRKMTANQARKAPAYVASSLPLRELRRSLVDKPDQESQSHQGQEHDRGRFRQQGEPAGDAGEQQVAPLAAGVQVDQRREQREQDERRHHRLVVEQARVSEDEGVESEHARNQQGSAQSYHQVEQQEGDHQQGAGRQDGDDTPVKQQPERQFLIFLK